MIIADDKAGAGVADFGSVYLHQPALGGAVGDQKHHRWHIRTLVRARVDLVVDVAGLIRLRHDQPVARRDTPGSHLRGNDVAQPALTQRAFMPARRYSQRATGDHRKPRTHDEGSARDVLGARIRRGCFGRAQRWTFLKANGAAIVSTTTTPNSATMKVSKPVLSC